MVILVLIKPMSTLPTVTSVPNFSLSDDATFSPKNDCTAGNLSKTNASRITPIKNQMMALIICLNVRIFLNFGTKIHQKLVLRELLRFFSFSFGCFLVFLHSIRRVDPLQAILLECQRENQNKILILVLWKM